MPKKRKIKIIIMASIVLIITMLFVKAYLFFNAKPNIAVNYVAEWNRISKPENYDPNQNAYFDYEKAGKCYVMYPEWLSSLRSRWPGDLNDNELSKIKEWVNDNDEALRLLRQGALKPYCWRQVPEQNWNTADILYPSLYTFRLLAIAIVWRAKLYAFEGKYEEAFFDILIPYKLSRQLSGRHRTLMEQLVANAIKALSVSSGFEILHNGHIDGDTLKVFQRKFEDEILKSEDKYYCEIEKIYFSDLIQRVFTDDGGGNGHLIPKEYRKVFQDSGIIGTKPPTSMRRPTVVVFGWVKGFFYWIWNVLKRNEESGGLRDSRIIWIALAGPDRKRTNIMLDETIQYLDKIQETTPWQRNNQGIDIEKESEKIFGSSILLFPKMKTVIETTSRVKTHELALVTTISLLRYKEQNGCFPDNLQQLIDDGFLSKLPMDPYNDGPLTYKKVDDNFILYSFGADFDDDGGTYSNWGEGNKGGDQVFWPVEKR